MFQPYQCYDAANILSFFENSVARFGDRIAIEASDITLSYVSLNRLSDEFASCIAGLGMPSRSVVGMYMEGSAEYVVAILGTLKAGMVFMPLSTRLPVMRLMAILEKTNPGLLITDNINLTSLQEKIQYPNSPSSCQDIISMAISSEDRDNLHLSRTNREDYRPKSDLKDNIKSNSNDACYIVLTSGSSGHPKAILGSHAGLAHFIKWEISEFGCNEHVRVSLLSRVTFDVSLRDIFVPLAAGGCLCIPDAEVVVNPAKLFNWMRNQRVTLTHMVPTLFRILTKAVANKGQPGEVFPELDNILLAGEPVFGDDIHKWRQAAGTKSKLVNLYGPSETTLAKLFHRIDSRDLESSEMVSIGRPIPDVEVYIVNEGKGCVAGEPGEIFIKTPFMSLGYYNDLELTRKHFVPNPLTHDDSDLVYQTGDLGQFDQEGKILFLGRRDGQVKLYGRRIELGEIEAFLRQHGEILQTVIVLKNGHLNNPRLVAYIVPKHDKMPTVESLRQFLHDRIPKYMQPHAFVYLKALPVTHSGKVDRQSLPEPGIERPELEIPYIPPANQQEKMLCQIWEQVLGLESIGIMDSFFDLGGNSILSMRLVERIKEAFRIDVPVVKIFQFPSVSKFSKFLQEADLNRENFFEIDERARRRHKAISKRGR